MDLLKRRIWKEVRPLLLPWLVVMLATAAPHFDSSRLAMLISWAAFRLGVPLLALLPWGTEFQCGTMPLLISQPVERMKLLREKTGVAIAAILPIAIVSPYGVQPSLHPLGDTAVFCAMVIGSAAFWTFRARSIVGAFVFSILPTTLVVEGGRELMDWFLGRPAPIESMVLTLCSAAVLLWLGRRDLARFQASFGESGTDLLMAGGSAAARRTLFRCRSTGPIRNLIRKELRLLRPLWLITAFYALSWIGLSFIARATPPSMTANAVADVLSAVLWGTFPPLALILAGSLSLGEERERGIQTWHLTLPITARRQWSIKLGVAVCAGILCAIVVTALSMVFRFWILGPPLRGMDRALASMAEGLPLVVASVAAFIVMAFWCTGASKGVLRGAMLAFVVMAVLFIVMAAGGDVTAWRVSVSLAVAVAQSYWLFVRQPRSWLAFAMSYFLPLAVVTFFSGYLPARVQAAQEKLSFEVASVKVNKSGDRVYGTQYLPGGRFTATNIPIFFLLMDAYDVTFQRLNPAADLQKSVDRRVLTDRYDIEAVAPAGSARKEQLRLMVQNLLVDRFKLSIHREAKEQPIYAIVVGKNGPKLQKSAIQERDCPDETANPKDGIKCHSFGPSSFINGLHGEAVDLSDVAGALSAFSDRPVIDKTGLLGLYNVQTKGWVDLRNVSQPARPAVTDGQRAEDQVLSDPSRPTAFAVFEDLGLKLEAQTGRVETIVVDHLEPPTEN